jgi:hypothetical protein
VVTRIRWEPALRGGQGGMPGTSQIHMFLISGNTGGDCKWFLAARLPGMTHLSMTSNDPEALKEQAEKWLQMFIARISAEQPEAGK